MNVRNKAWTSLFRDRLGLITRPLRLIFVLYILQVDYFIKYYL